MLVRDCRKCDYYIRRVWSQRYEPNNYHAIGFSHAYGWCLFHKKRCRVVQNCGVGKGFINTSDNEYINTLIQED